MYTKSIGLLDKLSEDFFSHVKELFCLESDKITEFAISLDTKNGFDTLEYGFL